MNFPPEVLVTEVSPRDGFQVEAWIPTEIKVEVIDALSRTGPRRVSPGCANSGVPDPRRPDRGRRTSSAH